MLRRLAASHRVVLRSSTPLVQASRFSQTVETDDNDNAAHYAAAALTTAGNPLPVNFEDVSKAMHKIRNGIVKTGLKHSHFLSELTGMDIHLKLEFEQFTGSFKERGARNALFALTPEEKQRGVIAASAGNHALALAWHGKQMGIPVTVVMPVTAPLTKQTKTASFGATVVTEGAHILDSAAYARSNPEFEGMKYINGFDDAEIIAGAGTMGMEILEQDPDTDYIVIPVGGGGLIAGVSLAAKTLNPGIKVLGVEPEFCSSMMKALESGEPTPVNSTPTLADGLAVPTVGANAYKVSAVHVDEVVPTSERSIALAVLRLLEMEKYCVEGAGATGLAALLPGGALDRPELKGKKVVVPLCGGNIDVPVLGRVIDRGLAADNRLVRFVCKISDRPGGISNLTRLVADAGGSIRDIYHERAWLHTNMDQVQIKMLLEVTGKPHQERIEALLTEAGYDPVWGEKTNIGW
ncbi:unnamed protein product [Chrysoparadoxa australica]